MKFSYADRSNLGDPDFVSEALELAKRMAESKVYAGTKRSKIDITRTFGVGYYEGYYELDGISLCVSNISCNDRLLFILLFFKSIINII